MPSAASTAEILLKINSDLSALAKARSEFSSLKGEISSVGAVFKGAFAANIAADVVGGMANAIRSSFGQITSYINDAVKEGVKFNATLETSQIGIAAVMRQFNPEKYRSFTDATRDAAGAIDLLKKKALESPATFESLLQAFQGTTGQMTSAGIAISKQVDLITNMSQALSGLGIRSEQILQETRALVTGNINEDAMAARILGITASDINNAKEKGRLYEFLSSKITAFAEAGKLGAQSIAILESNLQDAKTQQAAKATTNLTESYRELLKTLTAGVAGGSYQDALRAISDGAAVIVSRFRELLAMLQGNGALTGAVKKFSDYFKGLFWANKSGSIGEYMRLSFELAGKELVNLLVRGLKAAGQGFIEVMTRKETWNYMFAQWKFSMLGIADLFVNVLVGGAQRALAAVLAGAQKLQNPLSSYGSNYDRNMAALQPLADKATAGTDAAFKQSAGDAFKAGQEYAKGAVDIFFDKFAQAGGIFDTTAERAKLGAMIGSGAASYDAFSRKAPASSRSSFNPDAMAPAARPLSAKDRRSQYDEMLRTYRNELEKIRAEFARIDSDFTKRESEKWTLKKKTLEDEKAKLDEIIKTLEEKLKLEKEADPKGANVGFITGQIEGFQKDREGVTTKSAGLGADPNSFFDQMQSKMIALQDEWGTMAQQMAQAMSDAFSAMSDGISGSIQGLINQTMTWGQALANIGRSIVQSIIKSFADMVAQWIVSHLIMKGVMMAFGAFQSAFRAKDVAEANATEAAKTPMLATNATLASVSSFGVAAIIGIAAIAAILAAASGGFAEGGYTGGSNRTAPAGIVHEGEWVAPKWMVDHPKFGPVISDMESFRNGASGGQSGNASRGYGIGGWASLGQFLGAGMIPKWAAIGPNKRFQQKWNLLDGTQLYGGGSKGRNDQYYDSVTGQWVKGTRPSSAYGAAAGGSDYASAATSSNGTTSEGRPLQLIVVDSRREATRIAEGSEAETQIVTLVRREWATFNT